ncbi:DUF4132 domain-containing protein [Brevibacillus daliensis]|uniref:DUF4132 domain-containing protein n=1 Tax=Brevibacillus daliensis TaxID=2892995 RepID=UPI001E3D54CE|nr:DUF4132 domain-containing protein [Brevibacillus daliensis]
MVLKKSQVDPLISLFATKFSHEFQINSDQYEELIDYVSGESNKYPGITVFPNVNAYDSRSILEKMKKKGTDQSFYRAAEVLFFTGTKSYNRNSLMHTLFDDYLETIDLGEDLKNVEQKKERFLDQIKSVKEYMGDRVLEYYIDNIVGGFKVNLRNNYDSTDAAVKLMVKLTYISEVGRSFIEKVKERIHPFMFNMMMNDENGVKQELAIITEKLFTSPRARKENSPSVNFLDQQFLHEKRERICQECFPDVRVGENKALDHMDYRYYSTVVSAAVLYKINLTGSKEAFLKQVDEIDQALLKTLQQLYEIIPLELIYSLLHNDGNKEAHTNQLLDGILPTTEPYDLVVHLIRELHNHQISWDLSDKRVLSDLKKAERALEIISDDLIKGYLYKILQDNGVDMSKQDQSLEDIVMGSLKKHHQTRNLYQYLMDKISLQDAVSESAESTSSKEKGMNAYAIKEQMSLLTFLGVEHPIYKKFVTFLTHYGNSEENISLLNTLYKSKYFDPFQVLEKYADEKEMKIERFLLEILNHEGNAYYEKKLTDTAYQKIVIDYFDMLLPQYGSITVDSRMIVMQTIIKEKEVLGKERYYQAIQQGLNDTSKKVSSIVQAEFFQVKEKDFYLGVYQSEKKAKSKELALEAMRGLPDSETIYRELLESETNKKFKALLQSLLESASLSPADIHASLGNLVDKKKLARLKWLDIEHLPVLKDLDGKELGSEVKEYIISQSLECTAAPNENVLQVKEYATPDSLANFAVEFLKMWIDNKAPAKEKGVLFISTAFGDRRIVDILGIQIKEWAESGRGAIASDAVKALSFMRELTALITIDQVKRTVKNRQVRSASEEAMEMAARNMNITSEELEDRLVTMLGFDQTGKRVFSYGERTFTVKVNNELQLVVTNDETGKAVKNLPAPAAKDDATLAEQAKAEFSQLKKDLKTMVSIQSLRLEGSLSKQRLWSTAAWKNLFVENIIMQKFAIGLIWGVFEDSKRVETFRYLDDGTCNTADEEEYECNDNAKIGLVHPIELSQDELEAWKTQLLDYEITQPFAQLDRELHLPTEEEIEKNEIMRLPDEEFTPTTFAKNIEKYGWYKGIAQDAGFYHEFYKEYDGIIAELRISGASISYYEGMEDITLEGLAFYVNKQDRYHYYDNNQALKFIDISPRVFSETIYDVMRATGK